MTALTSRARFLAGAMLCTGMASVAAQPAQAACVVTASSVTCAPTTTTDTTNAGGTPAVDRNYPVDTSAGAFTGTVGTGALVDGFGLAFTNTVGGANTLNVVNDGTIQVDVGNFPTQGGIAALNISAIGATDINYSGAGSIANLGGGIVSDGFVMQSTGTGNITANVGGNVTATGAGSFGIAAFHSGTAGNINLTAASGTTIRAGAMGILAISSNAASTGTSTITNGASILSPTGAPNTLVYGIFADMDALGALTVANTGAIGSATDRLTGNGINAQIDNAASAAALSVTGSGPIWSAGTGLLVDNAGTGTTTVNYTGAIDTTAGSGILATGTSGALTVTSGAITTTGGDAIATSTTSGTQIINSNGVINANAGGISAGSTSGAITANVNANITSGANGVTLSSSGAMVVNLAATATIDSTGLNDIAFNGGGTGTVNNSGTIGATTAGTAIATGTATIAINNNSGGIINGVVTLAGGADTFSNTGTFNTAGVNAFGAGTDDLTNNAAGIINVLAGASFTGLETLTNAGTVNAASGLLFDAGATTLSNIGTINLTGALDLGAGTDIFANTGAGILNLTGNASLVDAETFTQSGRINLNTFVLTGTGAFVNSGFVDTSGSAGLAGFTSLSNSGTLDLAAGTFTVPAVVFTNSGTILADEGATTITGQTSFANSGTLDLQDGVVGDVLTIDSAFVGSGGSNLLIDFTPTTADQLVINGAASGSTAVNANLVGSGFNLDGVLVVDTTSATANAFVLGTVTGETPLFDVTLVQAGADFFLVSAPTAAAFNPLVVPGFATDLWYQSADEVFAETVKPATTTGLSFWGEGYISRDKYGDDDDNVVVDGVEFDVDNWLKTKRYGVQLGVDYGFGAARVGLTGGYAWAKADGDSNADLKAKGWNLGLYGQFGGITGFHGELLAKHDRYDAEFDDGAFDGQEFDIRSTGIDGSLGYRLGIGGAATMDLHAGVSHVRTKVDDIGAFGFNYDIAKLTSTRGRAGARATLGGSLSPYIDGTVYHEFKGDGDVELFDGASTFDLDTNGKGTWVRLEAGLSGNDGPGPILAAWGDFGDRKGIGLRAGWRLGGAIVAAAPPPPPPPPPPPAPPPPATQTCADGSVILATDMCPLPPPPPPPPPPEPERG